MGPRIKIILPLLLMSGAVLADESGMLRCRGIAEPAARLACYDALASPARAAEQFGREVRTAPPARGIDSEPHPRRIRGLAAEIADSTRQRPSLASHRRKLWRLPTRRPQSQASAWPPGLVFSRARRSESIDTGQTHRIARPGSINAQARSPPTASPSSRATGPSMHRRRVAGRPGCIGAQSAGVEGASVVAQLQIGRPEHEVEFVVVRGNAQRSAKGVARSQIIAFVECCQPALVRRQRSRGLHTSEEAGGRHGLVLASESA